MIFSQQSKFPIGLDISDLSLKLVQLKRQGNKVKIKAVSKIDLPAGLIENGEIKNQSEVVKKIKELISNPEYGKINSNNVVACLPEPKTFVKLISVDNGPNSLSDMIESEIQKHVPMLINEMYYDWQVIKEENETQKVLIGAAPKKIVDQYTDLLDAAKLSTEALEIEPISICRSLLKEETDLKCDKEKKYAVLDFGAKRTSMIVYAQNSILFSVSLPISGEKITEGIAKGLEIKKDQADKAKIVCGLDGSKANGSIRKILSDEIDELNRRVLDVLDFYSNHFEEYGPINHIYLCGGGANIKGLEKIISEATSIDVRKGNAFINIEEDKNKIAQIFQKEYKVSLSKNKISSVQDNSLTYVTAIGLALRQVFITDI